MTRLFWASQRWTASGSERPPEAACKSEQQQSPISQVLASRFQSA
jgi:hypothetical protein